MEPQGKRCIIFCKKSFGDGLIFLLLAHNLKRNGYSPIFYHEGLKNMQSWFPDIEIENFPPLEKIPSLMEKADLIIVKSDSLEETKKLVALTEKDFGKKSWVLHPTTCKTKNPLQGDFILDREISMCENLLLFCEKALKLKHLRKENGIVPPSNLQYRKERKRVAIHPTSGDIKKNYPKKKFEKIARRLKKMGFDPCFIMGDFERKMFHSDLFEVKSFSSFSDVASFLYESSYFIGNDSGLGHLASSLGLPTISLFSIRRKIPYWRPDFSYNISIGPLPILPNIKGMRWRDQYWRWALPSFLVINAFKKMIKRI